MHIHIGRGDSSVDLGVVSRRNPEIYSLGILPDHAAAAIYTAAFTKQSGSFTAL